MLGIEGEGTSSGCMVQYRELLFLRMSVPLNILSYISADILLRQSEGTTVL